MSDTAVHTDAWRRFKRMQASACAFAALVYAGAAVHAWRVLPGGVDLKRVFVLLCPAVFLLLVLWLTLWAGPLRRRLKRYVWLSFAAGFGQTAASVLTGFGVLALAAGLIWMQINGAAHGGRYPAGAFSALGAGLGVLLAQALLVTALEREPKVRAIIELP